MNIKSKVWTIQIYQYGQHIYINKFGIFHTYSFLFCLQKVSTILTLPLILKLKQQITMNVIQ